MLETRIFRSHFRFLDFLKNFSSDTIDIAFSSERAIQDTIEELSQTEASTVIISYTVMFFYVMIALGKFQSIQTILVRSLIAPLLLMNSYSNQISTIHTGSFENSVGLGWYHCRGLIGCLQFGYIRLCRTGDDNAHH